MTSLNLSEFANLAEFGVFGVGDRIHPGVIIITSENKYYWIIFVPVIILDIFQSAAHACNDEQ